MKVSDEIIYETGKASVDIAKLSAVALVITPLVQQVEIPLEAKVGLAVASLVFWAAGFWTLNEYAKPKELQQATRHKRHRIHIPKNTTINVDIEK